MRTIKYILLTFLIPTFMVSCENILDLKPESSLSNEQYWKTALDAKTGMAGIYDGLQVMLNSSECNYFKWGEVKGDNFRSSAVVGNQPNYLYGALNSTLNETNWTNTYRVISRANFAIKYLPTVPLSEVDLATQKNYRAQAHALRALCYFYAIRVWGNVPVHLAPYESLDVQADVTATADTTIIRSVILADLDTAINLTNKTLTNVYEMNYGAMLALKCEVHIWRAGKLYPTLPAAVKLDDYAKVISTANKLFAISSWTLGSDPKAWKEQFLNPGKETLMALHWAYAYDGGGGIAGQIGSGSNNATYFPNTSLVLALDAIRTEDIRGTETVDTTYLHPFKNTAGTADAYTPYFPWNFSKFFPRGTAHVTNKGVYIYPNNAQCEVKLPLFRLADVYLMQAEAYNQLAGTSYDAGAYKQNVVDILNKIRSKQRVGWPESNPKFSISMPELNTTFSAESEILKQRQIELAGEGKRWFDLMRTGRINEFMDPIYQEYHISRREPPTGFGDVNAMPGLMYWPIHRDILSSNHNLTQTLPWN